MTKCLNFKYREHQVALAMTDDVIYQEMVSNGNNFYEWPMLEAMAALNPKGTVIDAGANFGNHSVFMGMFFPKCKVYSFEPVLENFELLRQNLQLNKIENVTPVMAGLGSKFKKMYYTKEDSQRWSQVQMKHSGEREVEIFILDQFDITDLSLIKIDVEGMEYDVIKGAIATISNCRPDIFVEIWEPELLKEISKTLAAFGYEIKQRYNHAPTYHFSVNSHLPVLYLHT